MAITALDLTKQAPRSPRVRLGGYAILPRMIDKGRAVLAGTNGEYNYACGLDEQFLQFTGVNAAAFKKQLAAGKGDGDLLKWINANAKFKHSAAAIDAWSTWQEHRAPDNPDGRAYLNEVHQKVAPKRTDIVSWFDLLDVDDYASFGGKV